MIVKKIYLIDGIPEEEFYEKNATDIDHFKNGDYWLISHEKKSLDFCGESSKQDPHLTDTNSEELPF